MKLRKIANLNLILPHRRQCLKEIVFKVTGVSVIIIGETSSGVPRLCDVLSSHSFDEKIGITLCNHILFKRKHRKKLYVLLEASLKSIHKFIKVCHRITKPKLK